MAVYRPKNAKIKAWKCVYTGLSRDQDGVRMEKEQDSLQKHVNISTPVIVGYDYIIANYFHMSSASKWVGNLYENAYLGTYSMVL